MLYKENKHILIWRELRKAEFKTQQQCFGCSIPFAVHLLVSWHLWGGGMGASLGSRERTQRQTASHSWEERAEREGGWVGQRNRRAALLCCPGWVRECTNGNQERMKTLSYPGNWDGRKSNVMAWRGKGNPGKCIQFQLLPRSEARPEVLPYSRCARE